MKVGGSDMIFRLFIRGMAIALAANDGVKNHKSKEEIMKSITIESIWLII